jgi:hypothetical protein
MGSSPQVGSLMALHTTFSSFIRYLFFFFFSFFWWKKLDENPLEKGKKKNQQLQHMFVENFILNLKIP